MLEWLRENADGLGALAMWVLAFFAAWCVMGEAAQVLMMHGYRKDVAELQEWVDAQVRDLHARLDNAGAPGVHPDTPPARSATRLLPAAPEPEEEPLDPPTVPVQILNTRGEVLATVQQMPTDTTDISAIDPQDRPSPWQHPNPTRPDFRRLPKPGEDGLAPTFVQPGDGTGPLVDPAYYGRHALPPAQQ